MSKILYIVMATTFLLTIHVSAQGRIPVAERTPEDVAPTDMLRVRSFRGVGPRAIVQTPVFNTTADRGVRSPQDWQRLLLEFDVQVPWIDEMNVQFFVLSMIRDPDTDDNLYSLFRRNVRFVDIQGGRDGRRRVDAFLRPAALHRFGRVVAAAAVVTIAGEVVSEQEDTAIDLPEAWWESPRVLDNPVTTIRDGYLLDRTETPWAVINYDDAEFVR